MDFVPPPCRLLGKLLFFSSWWSKFLSVERGGEARRLPFAFIGWSCHCCHTMLNGWSNCIKTYLLILEDNIKKILGFCLFYDKLSQFDFSFKKWRNAIILKLSPGSLPNYISWFFHVPIYYFSQSFLQHSCIFALPSNHVWLRKQKLMIFFVFCKV